MGLRHILKTISLLLILCSFAAAQTQPTESDADKAKKKKEQDERVVQLLDEAIGDAETLQLPQNRSIAYAMAGDMYWKFDEKKARDLFRTSGAELVTLNRDCEKEKLETEDRFSPYYENVCGNIRHEVLPMVARRDAELALELLLQTRPAKISEMMSRMAASGSKPSSEQGQYDPDISRLNAEIALEQSFALLSADENPERAIKMIKDSLAKGISWSLLSLLQKLNKKDEKKAADLAGDVIKKIGDMDFSKSNEELNTAIGILQFAFKPGQQSPKPKEKQFAFSETQVKDLANKIASTLVQGPKSIWVFNGIDRAMPMFEKFIPDKVASLKQKYSDILATLPTEFVKSSETSKLWNSNSTPEDVLAQLPKLTNEFERTQIYSALAYKIGEIEDETRAKKLIDQIPDEKGRVKAQEAFENAKIARVASSGKLEDARKLLANLTKKKVQIQRLVSLALEFQKRGTEKDIADAKSLMKDARSLIVEDAEKSDDIDDVMLVVMGYSQIEPDSAFRLLTPMLDKLNDQVQASAVLARFEARSNLFSKGELVMRGSNGFNWELLLFRYIPQMQTLAKADLDRMNMLAAKFTRSDCRLIVKLYALQGFTQDKVTSDAITRTVGY